MPANWPRKFTLTRTASFRSDFPNFRPHHCYPRAISQFDTHYNCIAWAARDTKRWWWPDDTDFGDGYWPESAPREATLAAFIAAFGTLGYQQCEDGSRERRFEKLAIFADELCEPTHAARQLPDGRWTSKFGDFEDVKHANLACVEGPLYGKAVAFVKRKKRGS
jgi:hypothetical protein